MYNGIKIYGNQKNSYVRAVLGTNTTAQNSREIILPHSELVLKPDWMLTTIMQADYNQDTPSLSASSYDINALGVVGYKVFRRKGDRLSYVADTDVNTKVLYDYNTNNLQPYSYYIFPKVATEKGIILSSPVVSDTCTPEWEGWSIVGLVRVSPTEYRVDTSNVWVLICNTESGAITDNTNKTLHDTYGRFPRQTVGNRRYKESNLKAYLGYIGDNCEYYDSQELMDKWEKFAHGTDIKLLKNPKGMVIPVVIQDTSFDIHDTTQNYPCTVDFTYIQVADAETISAYAVQEVE